MSTFALEQPPKALEMQWKKELEESGCWKPDALSFTLRPTNCNFINKKKTYYFDSHYQSWSSVLGIGEIGVGGSIGRMEEVLVVVVVVAVKYVFLE